MQQQTANRESINTLSPSPLVDGIPVYCTWFRNDEQIEHLAIRKSEFFIFKNGTLRLPPNERASGVYHCQIDADFTKVISDSIVVEYPSELTDLIPFILLSCNRFSLPAVLKRLFPGQQQVANISAPEHQPLVLACPFVSVPAARISWYFGNDSLANDNRRVKISVRFHRANCTGMQHPH